MSLSPSVFPSAAKQKLNMLAYWEWAEGTLDQKSLKKTDHISYIVDIHLSLIFLFFVCVSLSLCVSNMNLWKLTFVLNPINHAVVFQKTINHFEFSIRDVHRLNDLPPQPGRRRWLKTFPFCRCCRVPAGFCLPQGTSFHLSHVALWVDYVISNPITSCHVSCWHNATEHTCEVQLNVAGCVWNFWKTQHCLHP